MQHILAYDLILLMFLVKNGTKIDVKAVPFDFKANRRLDIRYILIRIVNICNGKIDCEGMLR